MHKKRFKIWTSIILICVLALSGGAGYFIYSFINNKQQNGHQLVEDNYLKNVKIYTNQNSAFTGGDITIQSIIETNNNSTNTSLTYKWYVKTSGSNTYNEISNQNSNVLVLKNLSIQSNGNSYKLVVYESASKSITSNELQIEVKDNENQIQLKKITLTSNPSANDRNVVSVNENEEITFDTSIELTNGTIPNSGVSYKWYKKDVSGISKIMDNFTTKTIRLSSLTVNEWNNVSIYVEVTYNQSTISSSDVTINVNKVPQISSVTISADKNSYVEGETIRLSSNVAYDTTTTPSPSDLSYEWYARNNSSETFKLIANSNSSEIFYANTLGVNSVEFNLIVTYKNKKFNSNNLLVQINKNISDSEDTKIRYVELNVNKQQFQSGDSVQITSVLKSNSNQTFTPNNNCIYEWYVKKDGSSNWEIIPNQNTSTLSFVIDSTYNNSEVKLSVTHNSYTKTSSPIILLVDNNNENFVNVNFTTNGSSLDKFTWDEGVIGNITANVTTNDGSNPSDLVYEWKGDVITNGKIENNTVVSFITDYSLNNSFFTLTIKNSKNQKYTTVPIKININPHPIDPNDPEIIRPEYPFKIEYAIENVDYFVDSSQQKITIPSAKNGELIEKWGNAPLPWKDDISQDDLIKMFNYIFSDMNIPFGKTWSGITFGKRKINSNDMANAFLKWKLNYAIDHAYIWMTNPSINFDCVSDDGESLSVYKNELYKYNPNKAPSGVDPYKWFQENTAKVLASIKAKTWYVTKMSGGHKDEYLISNVKDKKDFSEFISYYLMQIKPNMSDFDKFLTTCLFIMQWTYYGKMNQLFNDHNGVCADYGFWASWLLRLVGVDSFSMTTKQNESPIHQVFWTYMDVDGTGKKWYCTDLTEDGTLGYETTGSSSTSIPRIIESDIVRRKLIMDIEDGEFMPSGDTSHYNFNFIDGLPWYKYDDEFSNDKRSINRLETTGIGKYTFLNITDNSYRSKSVFVNGYWYYLSRSYGSNVAGMYKVKSQIIHNNNNTYSSAEPTLFDLPEKITPINTQKEIPFKSAVLNTGSYSALNLQQYGNYVYFVTNNNNDYISNNNDFDDTKGYKKIIAVPTNDNGFDWNNSIAVDVPHISLADGVTKINKYAFKNFEILSDGTIVFTRQKSYVSTSPITEKFKPEEFAMMRSINTMLINSNDKSLIKSYYRAMLGTNLINDYRYLDSSITTLQKDEFLNNLEAIDFANNPNNKLVEINNKYKEIIKNIYKFNDMFSGSLINEKFYITNEEWKNGTIISFYQSIAYTSMDQINKFSKNISYDIYYSKNKPVNNNLTEYQLLFNDLYTPSFNVKDINDANFDPNGYYVVKIHLIGNEDIYTLTNQCQVITTDDLLLAQTNLVVPTPYFHATKHDVSITNQPTNYLPNLAENWYDLPIKFKIDYSKIYYKQEFRINFVNFSNPNQIKTIYKKELPIGGMKLREELNFSKPSNDNHGIYYVELITYDSNDNVLLKQFSQFTFIFTKEDISNQKIFDILKQSTNFAMKNS